MDGFFGVVNNQPWNANESTLSAALQCIESIVALMNTTTSNNSGHNSKYSYSTRTKTQGRQLSRTKTQARRTSVVANKDTRKNEPRGRLVR